jgi:hypothetical protein
MKTPYGAKNAVFFSIGSNNFVLQDERLWDLRRNPWRAANGASDPKGGGGFFDMNRTQWFEVEVSGAWYRFDSEGYAPVESMSDMSKKICKYLVDNKVLLERTPSCVNILLKDRVAKLSPSWTVWNYLKDNGALTVLHSSQDRSLGLVTKIVDLQIPDDYIRSVCKELEVYMTPYGAKNAQYYTINGARLMVCSGDIYALSEIPRKRADGNWAGVMAPGEWVSIMDGVYLKLGKDWYHFTEEGYEKYDDTVDLFRKLCEYIIKAGYLIELDNNGARLLAGNQEIHLANGMVNPWRTVTDTSSVAVVHRTSDRWLYKMLEVPKFVTADVREICKTLGIGE